MSDTDMCGVPDTWTRSCIHFADECPFPSHAAARTARAPLQQSTAGVEADDPYETESHKVIRMVMDQLREGDVNPLQLQRLVKSLNSIERLGEDDLSYLTTPRGIRVNLYTRLTNGLLPRTVEEWDLAREELDPLALAELATRKPINENAVPEDLKPYRGVPYLTYRALASARDPDWQPPPEVDESRSPDPAEQDPVDPCPLSHDTWGRMQWHLRRARDLGWTGEWLAEDVKFPVYDD